MSDRNIPTDLVTRLNQMAAAGYAGWETAKEAAERLAWLENYVKACDNEIRRARGVLPADDVGGGA